MQAVFNSVMPCRQRNNFDDCFSVQLKINFLVLFCVSYSVFCVSKYHKQWECSLTRMSLTYVNMSFDVWPQGNCTCIQHRWVHPLIIWSIYLSAFLMFIRLFINLHNFPTCLFMREFFWIKLASLVSSIYLSICPLLSLTNRLTAYLLSYLLTPWCRVLLEKLTGLQLVKKFPAFHGIRWFITALTSVGHMFLSWASPIQSIYPHPTSWRSILILSTHLRLGLPSGFVPSGFPTKTLYTPLSSPIRANQTTSPSNIICTAFDFHTLLLCVHKVCAYPHR